MTEKNRDIISLVTVIVLLISSVALGYQHYMIYQLLTKSGIVIDKKGTNFSAQKNNKLLSFIKLLVAKVLKTEGDVNFEDRLKLENAVRELNDPNILAQWQKFVDSKKATDAQQSLKDLLVVLINKLG